MDVVESSPSIQFLTQPQSSLRSGLGALKDDLLEVHPVHTLLKKDQESEKEGRERMLERMYGAAYPASLEMERRILNRVQRLPFVPSSNIAMQSLDGSLDELDFKDVLAGPEQVPLPVTTTVHEVMERRLGL